jgi:multiple sugar transport system permease protein
VTAAPAAASRPRTRRIRRILESDHLSGWAFAFPAVFLIFVFGIVPLIWSALLSFQQTNLISPPHWIGVANFRALSRDPLFRQSVMHSLVYTALFVPISVAGGLFTAIALNRKIRGVRFYRTAVFVPVILSTIATAIMFLWLLDPNFGLVNFLLGWLGFDVIVYLAALQGIPPTLVEAAEIDGARTWGMFRNITLPLLGPATLFLVVWSSINALQLFDEVYFLTKGGPGTATYVVVYYLYSLAFNDGVAGYAAAIAYVLLVAIMSLTLVQLWVGKRLVYYAS